MPFRILLICLFAELLCILTLSCGSQEDTLRHALQEATIEDCLFAADDRKLEAAERECFDEGFVWSNCPKAAAIRAQHRKEMEQCFFPESQSNQPSWRRPDQMRQAPPAAKLVRAQRMRMRMNLPRESST